MKKITIAALIATIATGANAAGKKCEYGNTPDARLLCRYERGTAPEYYTGCVDIAAPEYGIERARDICYHEYEQHKANKAARKAAKQGAQK